MIYKSFIISILTHFLLASKLFALNVTVGASGATYTTDGINDEVEIQTAINAVHASGGGTVTLFDGTYNIQATRIVPKSNVILTGTSRNGTILASTRTYDYILFNTLEMSGFQLKNLTIDPQNAMNASGVRFELASQVLVENVKFVNVTCDGWMLLFGIDGTAAQNQNVFSRDNSIKNCLFDNHAGSLEMLLLFNSKNTLVEDCIFQNKGGACPILGGQPALGLWQKTDSISIKNCHFNNIAGYETIYYSNTSNNTLIEGCTFTNSGGIQGANPSDWGDFGVPHATGMAIRNCTFTGGTNSVTQSAISLGAVYNVLVKNCTISKYEEGILLQNGYFDLNDLCKNFAIVNTHIYNCNPTNNVHDLHAGALIQEIGGTMNGYWVCGSFYDNQPSPTQRQAVSFYDFNTPNSPTFFNNMYFLGTNIQSYAGHPKLRFLNDATQGSPFVVEDCNGANPPTYCSSCPNISDPNAVAWINSYDPTTATIIQDLMNYQTVNPILPVELLSFKGKNMEIGNLLTWELGDTKDVQRLDILATTNGRDFSSIANLNKNARNFLHKNPTNLTYYQLKINELDGNSYFSKIISLNREDTEGRQIHLFPNPVSDQLTVKNYEGEAFVIVNSLGQIVLKKQGVTTGENTITLEIGYLPSGFYVLQTGIQTIRFVKK